MALKVSIVDPCAQNVSKLLHAIADYIDINQKITINLDIKFPTKKEGE